MPLSFVYKKNINKDLLSFWNKCTLISTKEQEVMRMSKYLIVQTLGAETTYKRYKTIEGWSRNPEECWKFSKQGAKKIVDGLNAGADKSKFYKAMPHKKPQYSMKEV